MRLGISLLPPVAIAALLVLQVASGFRGFDRDAMTTGTTVFGLPGYLLGWGSIALLLPFLAWTYMEWRGRRPSGLFLTMIGACTLGIAVAGLAGLFGDAAAGGQIGYELANMLKDKLTSVPAFLVLMLMALPSIVLATTPLHGAQPASTQVSPATFGVESHQPLPGAAPRPLRASSTSLTDRARRVFSLRRNKSRGGNDGKDVPSNAGHHLDPDIRYVDDDGAPDKSPVDRAVPDPAQEDAVQDASAHEASEMPQSSEHFPRVPSTPTIATHGCKSDEPIEVVVDGDAFDEPEYVVPPKDGVRVVPRASTSKPTHAEPHESLPTLTDVMHRDADPIHISSAPQSDLAHSLEPWARIETDDDDSPIHVGPDGKPVKVTPAELHPGTVFPASDTRSPNLRPVAIPSAPHATTQEDISVAVRAHSESRPARGRQGMQSGREKNDGSTLEGSEAARFPTPRGQSKEARQQLEAAAEGRDAAARDQGAISAKSAEIPLPLSATRKRKSSAATKTGEAPGRAAILDALRGLPTLRAAGASQFRSPVLRYTEW